MADQDAPVAPPPTSTEAPVTIAQLPPDAATKILAPDITANATQNLGAAVAKSAARFGQVLGEKGEEAKGIIGGFQSYVDNINKKSSDVFQDIDNAVQHKTEIAQYPKAIANIWGYFDPNMSTKVQDERLTGAGMKLKEIQSQLQIADTAKNAALQAVQTDVDTAKGQLNAQTTALAGAQTQQQMDIAAKQAPATLAETHARIQQALLQTKAGTQQLAIESASPDELTKALDGKNPNLPVGLAQSRLGQLEQQKLNIESISQANQSGAIDLAKKSMDNLLMHSFTPHDLGDIITKMGDADSVPLQAPGSKLPAINVPKQALIQAFNARTQEASDAAEQHATREGLFAGFQTKQDQTDSKLTNIIVANGGTLPPELQNQYATVKTQIDAAAKSGGIKVANELLDKWQATVDQHIKTTVESHPQNERPFIKEFLESGKVSTANSADFIFSNGRIANTLEGTPFEWFENGFSNSLNTNVQSKASRMGGLMTGGASASGAVDPFAAMMGDDKFIDRSQAVYDVMQKNLSLLPSGAPKEGVVTISAKDLFRDSIAEDFSTKILGNLSAPVSPVTDAITGKQIPPPPNPYSGVLDINGRLSQLYRVPVTGAFNAGALAQGLEVKTAQLQKTGQIPPDQNLADLFLKQLTANRDKYVQHFNETSPMKLRAFNQLVNGQDPLMGFNNFINDFVTARKKIAEDAAGQAELDARKRLVNPPLNPGNTGLLKGFGPQ